MLVYLLVLVSGTVFCGAAEIHYEFVEEWNMWKMDHRRSYSTLPEELERHLLWLSNKKYIEAHNNYAEVFGYTLAMNGLGDMVYRKNNFMYYILRYMYRGPRLM